MKKILLLLFLSILLFNACSNSVENEPVELPSLEERIGQMLVIGFRGLSVSEDEQIVTDIQSGRIGGVVLYAKDVSLGSDVRNIESYDQVKSLISSLQSYAEGIPLFVAVDQEGGNVCRLKEKFGFPSTVSQQYLGDLDNEDTTKFYADRTAGLLYSLGFNLNFAPVVDVNIDHESPAIGKIERSFSDDPEIVAKHSQVIVDVHQDYNVLTTLKHFPGHGSASSDSHLGFTDVTSTWQESELEPYRNLINNG
ncbi:MAG: glycoside hydrolase family 3 N-terminal domain-containing protein [Ignavibacteria bacterium]|jgi:beta-N-acetylhexosaminidase